MNDVFEGNAQKPFSGGNSIIITRTIAKKYFGNEKALGKVLMVDGEIPVSVSAVIEDIPSNSHIHFDFALNFNQEDGWGNFNYLTYVLFKDNFNVINVNTSFQKIVDNYIIPKLSQAFGLSNEQFINTGNKIKLALQPLKSIHLNSNLFGEFETNGNKTYVIFFSAIAIFTESTQIGISCPYTLQVSTTGSMVV